MARKMIIKGVGTMMAKKVDPDGKGVHVVTLGSLQDLKIDLNVELEEIFGGDGLFAIDSLITSKSIEITATDAKFDLDAVRLMMGSQVQEQINDFVWVLNEQKEVQSGELDSSAPTPVSVGVVIPEFADTVFDDGNFNVRVKGENKLLTKVVYSNSVAPGEGEFMIDASGLQVRIIVPASLVGQELEYSYQRAETVDVVDILVNEVPFPVHIIHHGSFLQKDGTYAGIETELYACRAKGTFSIDTERNSASASSVSLQVIDPERADGKLGRIKRYSSNVRV